VKEMNNVMYINEQYAKINQSPFHFFFCYFSSTKNGDGGEIKTLP